jgi:hypothetical protein
MLLLLPLVLMNLTCNYECIDNAFLFTTEFKVIPAKDSLHVGDTLWIESSTLTKMIDMPSNSEVLFDGAKELGSTFRVGELLGPNNMKDAVDKFNYIVYKGNLYTDGKVVPNRLKLFTYVEDNGTYKLSFAIICETAGLYALTLSDAINIYSPRHGSCGRATVHFKFNNNDKHIKYLQDTYYKGYVIPDAVVESSYCFRVF